MFPKTPGRVRGRYILLLLLFHPIRSNIWYIILLDNTFPPSDKYILLEIKKKKTVIK